MKDENTNESLYGEQGKTKENIEKALEIIKKKPKRDYTEQEIDEARGNLTLMSDRVFFCIFDDDKNNSIITAIVNAIRKIHAQGDIEPIKHTELRKVSLVDVFERGMVGDLFGKGHQINIAVEVQKDKQDGYAIRSIITSGNAARVQFKIGSDFTEAPDVMGINILGFKLPELEYRKVFFSRIVRTEYDSRVNFLSDKYSEYFIELPKMCGTRKEDLPNEYHDLWDLCCIFSAKIKDYEEVIRVQKIANHAALELSQRVKLTVTPKEIVSEPEYTADQIEELMQYLKRQFERYKKVTELIAKNEAEKNAVELAEKKAVEIAEKKAVELAEKKIEEMLMLALQNLVPTNIIEIMRSGAGITEARLAELKEQALVSQSS